MEDGPEDDHLLMRCVALMHNDLHLPRELTSMAVIVHMTARLGEMTRVY